jgi:hypothetical protein
LSLIHIHWNNYSELDQSGNPTTIELTFEKDPKFDNGDQIYPNILDQPNNPLKKNINLKFI